ncbi:hypothetical protein [Haloarchaeobius iranensis]|uniref:Uncharacterized protein n=1 Tax=Haloarchaeobius iranensis TaxID=996166 RepID=A0A1G9UKK6_9EURY|nr:hypothetical protein [Haloarchaeobius iranensis]SDM60470.1 hypothetical protein SAMN05192554_104181 [Haloarchaeobius iranensis]
MSAKNGSDGELQSPARVEGGFLKQNSWLKPFALIQLFLILSLVVLDLANDIFVQIQGRFSNVLFGVILAVIALSLLTALIVLVVNAVGYVTNT